MKIGAVVLAAGESKRMGRQKLLLPWHDKTMIEEVISHLLVSKVDETLVVLGADSTKIEEKIKKYPVKTTVNPYYKKGMLSSVQWGFNQMGRDVRGVLVYLGDQPLIPAYVIDRVISSYKKSKKGIIIPVYKKKRGHPILIHSRYTEEINNLDPEIGLRGLVHSHQDDILEVKVESPGILKDIDDQDDYSSAS